MSAPKRIQRKRTKGWRMPEGAVYVGRPTKWGNPFKVGEGWDAPFVWHLESYDESSNRDGLVALTPAMAVEMFRESFGQTPELIAARSQWCAELRGKDLACYCPLDQPCHADVLLEWANAPGGAE